MKKHKKLLLIVFLLFPFVLLFSACDNQPKQKKQKAQNVITKKIIPAEQQTNKEEAKTDKTAKAKIDRTTKAKTDKIAKAKIDRTTEAKIENQILTKENNLKIEIENDKTIDYYISEGKLDPFISPIKKTNKDANKKINRKLGPLEKLDLSQIKLVAIISMKSGKKNVAMVQESSGKGYMVKVGTYIGRNNGRIIEIKNDKIIIKESIKNFSGLFEDRLETMKLQKKDNG
jgi:type IV pilus assembly protein PilP